MKVKTDFVTNSSSSSFVVAWPNKITSINDVEKYISSKFCKTIFNDAINQKPISSKADSIIVHILSEVNRGVVVEFPGEYYHPNNVNYRYHDHQKDFCESQGITEEDLRHGVYTWRNQFWTHTDILGKIEGFEYAYRFIGELKDEHYIYTFQYADGDGEYFSELEHGGTFSKLIHIKVSMH